MPGGPFYFAWAGGAIADQTTTVTTGSTHGGTAVQFSVVGDVGSAAAPQQIRNLASTSHLQVGAMYAVSGSGIADGTWFVYDDSLLAGDGVNLSGSATGTYTSATLSLTESIPVANIVGTLVQGSSTVSLPVLDLPAGYYTIAGTGIGETDLPPPPGEDVIAGGPDVLIVSTAVIYYDGGTTAEMIVLAAYGESDTYTDSFGQTVTRTAYTVVPQPVRATTSGDFAMVLAGLPSDDVYRVSAIDGMALSGLVPGARYNINGNGIEIGSTFVAPDPGATEIFLDLPTTASNVNALLTIEGPRTPNAPFDPAYHLRFDELILGFEISQDEGNFATLTIDIQNPSTGLLAAGRNLWCWLVWDSNWSQGAQNLVALFNGRLVGIPKLAAEEVAQLQFLARPDDFNYQKSVIVDSLKVAPYYDPVWFTVNVTADTVLEAYSALWHVDRVTLELTTSDILQGEDGTIEIGEGQAFYDAFSLSYGQPPLLAVTVSGTVTWQQQAEGVLEVTQTIVDAFSEAGSPYPDTFAVIGNTGGGGLITVLVGEGLKSDWPKPGTNIGGGWALTTRNDDEGVPYCYIYDASKTSQGGWIEPEYYSVRFSSQRTVDTTGMTQDEADLAVFNAPYGDWEAQFPISIYKIRMALEYRADRKRTETITAVMVADVQRELSDTSEEDRETMSLSSEYVGAGIDIGGGVPIGDLARRSYFQTDRGTTSYQYLLLAARAKIRARARAADVTFAVDFSTALGITLRNSVRLIDRRLPGGAAEGKVKSYKISMAEGVATGEFTIGCAIGNGNNSTAVIGAGGYVDDGYASNGYNVEAAGQVWLLTDELAYQRLDEFAVVDDGLDLTNLTVATAVNECVVVNGLTKQFDELKVYQDSTAPTRGDPITTAKTLTTTCTLDLKPVAGAEYETLFYPAVSMLALPKTIDLAAPPGR